MKFWFRNHHYETAIKFGIKSRLSKWFGQYRFPVSVWLDHLDDCCDYWTPISAPRAQRAMMVDDDFALKPHEDTNTAQQEQKHE